MYLSYRATKPADLKQCFQLIPNLSSFADGKSRMDLLAFWRFGLARRFALSAVALDHERPRDKQVVGFGMSLFGTPEFVQAIRSNLPPYFPLQAVRWWRQGRMPFLGPKAIARENTDDGLSLLILHFGVERQKTPELEMQIRAKMHEAFTFVHGGYHLKEILQESYSPFEKDMLLSVGCRLLRDYDEQVAEPHPDPSIHTCLLGMERDEEKNKYSVLGPIFLYPRPRFGFSLSSQRVLQQALLGETDKEIGKGSGLSIWTVKKRWQEIYEKVEKLEPALLAPSRDEKTPPGEEPATQRRRLLLTYLRGHLEEIRPYDPLRKVTSGGRKNTR